MANRLCNDVDLFTMVMPIKDRPEFLRRSLNFLASQGFEGQMVIPDGSNDAMSFVNKQIVDDQKKIKLVYVRTGGDFSNWWIEMRQGLKDREYKYSLLYPDDDFFFLDEIDYCLDFLENNEDYVSASGRFLWIRQHQNKNEEIEQLSGSDQVQVELSHMAMYSFNEPVVECRIADMFNRYCHLFFSVMRSEAFLNALEQVPRYFPTTGWLDQFAFTIVCGVRGKSHTSARLYCIRQQHPARGSIRTATAEPYRHWPWLLVSPDFSDNYQSFRRCLTDSCRAFVSVSEEKLKSIIDYGLITLIKRGFGVKSPLEREDKELLIRLKDSSSIDHQRMRQVIPFLVPILPEG